MRGQRLPTGLTIGERLLRRRVIAPATGCWEWAGCTNSNGYGMVYVGGTTKLTHRLAYAEWRGPIGALHVCHRCDNPLCFNPDHLFLGTHSDNMRDMAAKGRGHFPEGAAHWTHKRPEARPRGEAHHNARFTDDEVRAIRADPRSLRQIAAAFGCSRSAVDHIRAGRRWAHVL